MKKRADIVILGAGIGGYEAFRCLSKELKNAGLRKKILLVDQHNYFTFTPMLHEVASGSVQASHCAIPIRQVVHKTPHEFLEAKVTKIDPRKKKVFVDGVEIDYEYCVVGLGSRTNFFGTKGAQEYAMHVRDLPAAVRLQQRVIKALECNTKKDLNLVVVGGGPTGVELAGQFEHLSRRDAAKLYPDKKVNVTLVQAGECLLPYCDKYLQKKVLERFEINGVKVLLNKKVKEVKNGSIVFDNGKAIKVDLVAWAAGFSCPGAEFLGDGFLEKGRIVLNQFLQSRKNKSLYAVGDIAYAINPNDKKPYPSLGEVAHEEGMYVARHIMATIQKSKMRPFSYKLKGTLIAVGDWYAVADFGFVRFSGRFAWWIRRTIYLHYIPGFLRKLRIIFDWTMHSFGFRYMVDLNENDFPCE